MNFQDLDNTSEAIQKKCQKTIEEFKILDLLKNIEECFSEIRPHRIKSLESVFNDVAHKKGEKEMENIRQFVLSRFLIKNWNDFFSDKYTDSIKEQFEININRLITMCQNETGWGKYNDEVYWKDLALARQQMYPAGAARVVEVYSGFGLRQGFGNFFQSYRFIKLLSLSGGKTGYYQHHLHTPLLSDFNESGFYLCYNNIVSMLIKYPKIKGVFGAAWYYDPKVGNISPKLKYLHDIPTQNGAGIFRVGKDSSGSAIQKSQTRRKLYEKGMYEPALYLMIWPRKAIIKWASQHG